MRQLGCTDCSNTGLGDASAWDNAVAEIDANVDNIWNDLEAGGMWMEDKIMPNKTGMGQSVQLDIPPGYFTGSSGSPNAGGGGGLYSNPIQYNTGITGVIQNASTVGIGALLAGAAGLFLGWELLPAALIGAAGGYLWNQNPLESAGQLVTGEPPVVPGTGMPGNPPPDQGNSIGWVLVAALIGAAYIAGGDE